MKKLVPLLLVFPLFAYSQPDCESHAAIGLSYILPKGISVEGSYFTNTRLNAGIGVSYTLPAHTIEKTGTNETENTSNSFNIFAYAGYKILNIDYVVSAFLNAGYTMGDVNGLQPFISSKILFPSGQKAFSIEPFYVFNRGWSGRATVYLKL